GLMVLAHRKRTATELARLFRERKIVKRYQAWVVGHYIADENSRLIEEPIDGRPALSRVSLLEYNPQQDRSLLQVEIDTGRKHQIRRHLSGIGYPVVGDRLYCDTSFDEDLQLTCIYLEIPESAENVAGIYRP
ncbi:MAG: RNA pseudouridine synthase, partial [Candidatus Thiodiazotropha taylori]